MQIQPTKQTHFKSPERIAFVTYTVTVYAVVRQD